MMMGGYEDEMPPPGGAGPGPGGYPPGGGGAGGGPGGGYAGTPLMGGPGGAYPSQGGGGAPGMLDVRGGPAGPFGGPYDLMRQGSAESSYSHPSSEMSLTEAQQYEAQAAGLGGVGAQLPTSAQAMYARDAEANALLCLDRARSKPVAFAVRTNILYDGGHDDDSPVHGSAVSFNMGDFLHIYEKYDVNWWIGRIVKEGCDIGFIPSPYKLEQLILQQAPVGKASKKSTSIGNIQVRGIKMKPFFLRNGRGKRISHNFGVQSCNFNRTQ